MDKYDIANIIFYLLKYSLTSIKSNFVTQSTRYNFTALHFCVLEKGYSKFNLRKVRERWSVVKVLNPPGRRLDPNLPGLNNLNPPPG